MRNAATRFGALVAAALTLSLAACDGTSSRRAGDVGAVKMALDIAPGTTLNTVSYVINGPGAFMKTGTLDVSHSSTISADFSPLPPGMGYTIGLSATSMDGGTMCMGSQTFDVAARMTTSVLVHLLCRQPTTNGSVTFNGALNVCPLIDSIGSSPSEVFVGGSIMLSALGHDTDSGPSPLTYQWTATPPAAGTLNNATLQNATFACAAPGSVSITLTLSDGDGACIDTQTMSVTCTASPSGSGGSVGSAGTSGSAGSSTGAAGATGGAGGGAAGATGGAGGGAAGATGGVGGGAAGASGGAGGGVAGASGGAGGGAAGASGGAGGGAAGATGGAGGGAAGASGGAGGGAAGATGGVGGGAAGASGGAGGGAAGATGGAGGGAAGASGGAGGGAAGATGGVGGGAAGATGGAGGSVSCGPGSSNAAVVVYRVGDGSGSLLNTGNVVVLDAFTAAGGSPVCSTALPTTPSGTNHSLIASGTATSEGLLSRSTDGHSIVLAGYGGMLGVSSLSGTTSAATPRVVARVDAAGAIDTTTALTDWASGNNPRSVASTDGTSLWLGGAAGSVRFASLGATTSTQLNTVLLNIRQVSIFGGQLYSSSSSSTFRLATVGTGLPTTAGQTITNLPAWPTTGSPYGFFFADLDGVAGIDTVYVADDGSSGTFGGLDKYSLVGGSWAANGILGTAADAYRGLTGTQNGSTVTLYATRKGGAGATGGGELVSIVDASGFNAMITATPTVLATAANNTAYRGVALAPQ